MALQWLIQKIKTWLNPSATLQTLTSQAQTYIPSVRKAIAVPRAISSDSGLRKIKLIMVTAENNNKYYDMEENDDGTFTVLYGRVGATQQKRSYKILEWENKYREKINKGYTDQTSLFAKKGSEITTESIENKSVKILMESFLKYANQSILQNYTVLANQVTRKQIEEAQQVIERLVKMLKIGVDERNFNENLLNLFKVIPRKMGKVNDFLLANSPNTDDVIQEIKDRLGNEQSTLDVMRTQVELLEQNTDADSEKIGFLESMGLIVEEIEDEKVIKLIKLMMGSNSSKFESAYKINNLKTQRFFDDFIVKQKNQKTTLLWHGSRNENWLSILKEGLVLRPANAIITGKMFGYGIYFANEFGKSLNYTSLNGSFWAKGSSKEAYLSIYEVHTGNQKVISQHETWCQDLTLYKLKKLGDYDSIFAKRGISLRNNEFIVYNDFQCTIKYIVKVKP